MTRTIVLLGAGASHDAGLPLTNRLAQILVEKLQHGRPRNGEAEALNFVYSQMVGHQGEGGGDPLRDVNIETLISAVRLLQDRESHEVAPFVSAWKAGALGFGGPTSPFGYDRQAQQAVEKAIAPRFPSGNELANLISHIAREVTTQSDASSFVRLEAVLLGGIQSELSRLETTSYLNPLADLARSQDGGLDIVTLNYDLTIETMAASTGVDIDRGIERWVAGVPLSFECADGRINLIKLHGSVDWSLAQERPVSIHPPKIQTPVQPTIESEASSAPPPSLPGRPWIVVGDREKLATDGPTLDLLYAAIHAFNRADRLVVVGYSFGDAHVNAIVRNWMAAETNRTITIVDPAWPSFESGGIRGQIAAAYGASDQWSETHLPRRLAVVTESALTGLADGLVREPRDPDPYATVRWGPQGDEVVVQLLGPSMHRASVGAWPGVGHASVVSLTREARQTIIDNSLAGLQLQRANFGEIEQGGEVTVYPILTQDIQTLDLVLEGYDLLGRRLIRLPSLAVPAG